MKEVEKAIGFSLEVKQSKIEHHEAGDGVFLRCTNDDQKVTQGTLLGIVPGIINSSYEPPEHKNNRVEKGFLTCYDNTYVNFSAYLPYPLKFGYSLEEYYDMNETMNALKGESNAITEVEGHFLNPYALGHKINHPPPDTSVNVSLIDMMIPEAFFPEHLLAFLPYVKISSDKDAKMLTEYYHSKCYHGLGIIATEEIKDGDELYCDYFEHSRYSMEFTPDWLIRPPPASPYLKKYEYENNFSFFGRIIDAYLLSKKGNMYEKFVERTAHDQDPQTLLKKTLIKDKIQAKKTRDQGKQNA